MTPILNRLARHLALGLLLGPLATPSVLAGPGHDHGDEPAAPAATALPRFSAASDAFELVGVLDGRKLTLWLDRAEDNAPVSGARLELDLGSGPAVATPAGEVYELTLIDTPAPGVLPVTATVTAGTEVDLLAGELDLHAAPADAHVSAGGVGRPGGAVALAALVAVIAVLGLALVRRRRRRDAASAAALMAAWIPAVALGLGLTLSAGPARAGGDHDHGHDHGEAAAPRADGPRRLPDGRVFLPKSTQRLLGLRTLPVQAGALPRSTELNGQVVMDPAAGGRVQPLNAGRIEPGPRGLPHPGQAVRRGEVLAWVVSTATPLERSAQAAQLAELRAAAALAERRVARLRELSDTVPRKDLEAAESEARSLDARIAALGQGLDAREALVAPVSGVIAAAEVVAGQVVDARELVFEVVDPTRLRIEALAHDPALAADIGAAHAVAGGARVPLRLLGAARRLRDQALPLHFGAQGTALSALAVGQPVRVVVQARSTVQGLAVPAAALVRDAANQTIVWVKTAPERFEPRAVTVAPLDGVAVAVTAGLAAGDRVVTQAAVLLNQVR